MSAFITVESVRDEIQDRTPGDNSIENDLFFSDEEIVTAMKRAAARYNQIPPMGVDVVDYRSMPANSGIFMDAVVSQLYASAMHKINRNIIGWQAGDVSVEVEKNRLQAFATAKQALDQVWRADARDRKSQINQSFAWGYY